MDDYKKHVIDFVREHPLIWDPSHKDYKNTDQRQQVWEAIDRDLTPPAGAPTGWDTPYQSIFHDCEGENCLMISRDDLCAHESSDHNYHAICRNILSRYAIEPNMEDGLLHDMPPEAEDYWDLGNLLDECARPSQPGGRWRAKNKLLHALSALKDGSKEHLEIKEPMGRSGDNT